MKHTIDLKTVRSQSVKDLIKSIDTAKQDLVKMTMDIHFGKSKETAKIRVSRKNIARMQTILSEKLIEAASQEQK